MIKKSESSDPLPYTQVDRAVKPKAMLLAQALNVTVQHALGSLIEFWELNGEPRALERLLGAGTREVVLSAEEVVQRFRLASGKDVDPWLLANLGLLEPREDGRFRVRGMSRFFRPIEARIRARQVAAAGGKASVEARKSKFGSADPRSQLGSPVGSQSVHTPGTEREPTPEPTREPDVNRLVKQTRTGREAADSGQRTPLLTTPLAGAPSGSPPLMERLSSAYQRERGASYPLDLQADGAAMRRLLTLSNGDEAEIERRWPRALRRADYPRCNTLAELAQQKVWSAAAADPPPKPGASGRAADADKDHSRPAKTKHTEFGEELDLVTR